MQQRIVLRQQFLSFAIMNHGQYGVAKLDGKGQVEAVKCQSEDYGKYAIIGLYVFPKRALLIMLRLSKNQKEDDLRSQLWIRCISKRISFRHRNLEMTSNGATPISSTIW